MVRSPRAAVARGAGAHDIVDDALTSGVRIGSYEVIDRLGAGGMGQVYSARDTRLGRTVAIKVLHPGADPDLVHRLDREARAASALNHPNIVHIYDVGEAPGESGAHYVVMEYVEGETLRRRLRRGALALDDVLALGAQVADGLAKAHRAGIVHRDLKPENLMVTPDGLLKILDFGLAKRVVAPLADLDARETLSRHGTQAGMLVGTLEYMSPEQAAGRTVDHRTDQFSLGLILHEMLTGQPAFRRETPAQVLAAVIERDPPPLRNVRPETPAALDELVRRCVQKDPERRFARTDELASELAALAGRSRAASIAGTAPSSSRPDPISVEVLPSQAPRASTVYHVQVDDKIRIYEEADLAERIRKGKLTGMELARRDDEDDWQPLFDSRVYRREIPVTGDPREAARWRALRGLGGHFTGFFITGVVMFSLQGALPFWMAIWGAVLAVQTIGSLPKIWPLLRRGRLPAAAAGAPPALPGGVGQPVLPRSPLQDEAARVRALIEQRGGQDAARLVAEVDGILKQIGDLAAREVDLEEQTSERERSAVAAAVAEARARLERAELPEDQRLFERQVEVLQGREEAMAKAVRVLDRLRVRREVAEHQLKQLRLDLSRGAASGLDLPELSSRLQFIRYEVDAREEVEQIAAERR